MNRFIVGNQANSVPQTYRREVRPLRYLNTTNEKIPPFACIQSGTQTKDGAEVVWNAFKPSTATSLILNARNVSSRFIFNLARSCPRLAKSEGTVDYPCQALFRPLNPTPAFPFGSIDGSAPTQNNAFAPGSSCGARLGNWFLDADGSHFVCRSLDASNPIGTGGLRTIWVEPNHVTLNAYGNFFIGGFSSTTIQPFQTIPVSGTGLRIETKQVSIGSVKRPVIVVKTPGIYFYTFGATISSTTAPRGTPLAIQSQFYFPTPAPGNVDYLIPSNQTVSAMRLQDIEQDTYYIDNFTTAENVVLSGQAQLRSGDGIYLRNMSSWAIQLQSISGLQIFKHSEHPDAYAAESELSTDH